MLRSRLKISDTADQTPWINPSIFCKQPPDSSFSKSKLKPKNHPVAQCGGPVWILNSKLRLNVLILESKLGKRARDGMHYTLMSQVGIGPDLNNLDSLGDSYMRKLSLVNWNCLAIPANYSLKSSTTLV